MKKLLLIISFFLTLSQAQSQPDLNIVWQKDLYPWGRVDNAKIATDGSKIYIASYNTIWKIDAKTGELDTIPYDRSADTNIYDIENMEISKLGNLIISVNGDGAVDIWDVRVKKLIKKIQYGVASASISPDEKKILINTSRYKPNKILLYDLLKDSVLAEANCNGLLLIKYSHDGKYFVTGSQFFDITNTIANDQLILWDAISLKPIDTLENTIGSAGMTYALFKFSLNDKYLGVINARNGRFIASIYYLTTKKIINKKDENLDFIGIEFLPDNLSYLRAYLNSNLIEKVNLIDGKILQNINFYANYLESTDTINGIFSVFITDGARMYFMKSSLTGIEPEIKSDVIISYYNDKLNIEFAKFIYDDIKIQIIDILGNVVYNDKLENLKQDSKVSLNLNITSGAYLCKVNYGENEFVQKILVVR